MRCPEPTAALKSILPDGRLSATAAMCYSCFVSETPPAALRPEPGERGLATADPQRLVTSTLAAWDAFIDVAAHTDPDLPLRKGTAGEALANLGTWPGSRTLDDMRSEAAAGATRMPAAPPPHVPSHPSSDELVAAIRTSRDSLLTWVDGTGDWQREGLLTTPTILGPLPLLTSIHGAAYAMALVALEIAGADPGGDAPTALLDTGLDALVDTTGGLAARVGVAASITARIPERAIGTGALAGEWCSRDVSHLPVSDAGPAIVAPTHVVLAVTAGRADVASLYRTGSLRVHDLPGLLPWIEVVEAVPGLPGGAVLARAGRYLGTVSRLLSRLPFNR